MELSPEEALTRDVYAHFGLAYYLSECVHRALVNVFAHLPFGVAGATRPRIEERTKVAERMTLGDLITNTRGLLPSALHPSLDWALTTRNFYAHGFWYERIHMMTTEEGKASLIAELDLAADLMRGLNQDLDALVFAHLRTLGLTEEHLALAMAEASEPVEPLPDRPLPRKEETVEIIASWTVGVGSRSGLLLQDATGRMWQLCDEGLGWHYGAFPEDNWEPFGKLNAFLPAKIVARPKSARTWKYKLHVSTGALVCVEPDETGVFRWSVVAQGAARKP